MKQVTHSLVNNSLIKRCPLSRQIQFQHTNMVKPRVKPVSSELQYQTFLTNHRQRNVMQQSTVNHVNSGLADALQNNCYLLCYTVI